MFKKPNWLTLNTANSPKTEDRRFFILDRSCYREVIRNYKVSALDLLRLVKNELTVLKAEDNKVLWYIRRINSGQYNVCYAVLYPSVTNQMSSGFSSMIPETWLLYSMLTPEKIYHVHSIRSYWGYLSSDGILQTTLVSGLMADAQLFANALGIMPQDNPQPIDLQKQCLSDSFVLPLSLLPGAIVVQQTKQSIGPVDYKLWGKRLGITVAAYCLVVSAGLSGYKYFLNSSVTALKVSAEAVFNEQQTLNQRQEQIDDYTKLLQHSQDSADILNAITTALGDSGQLERIQLSSDRIQITGLAKSATLVLSKFAESSQFAEVKFDRNIQRVREQESFSIIMTYKTSVDQSKQSGANDATN